MAHVTTYRIYGPAHGAGSFRAVTRGFLEGLEGTGRTAHLYPTDVFPDEEREPVPPADVGIWCGFPSGIRTLRISPHTKRFVMVAPNSSVTPDHLFEAAAFAGAKILVPSRWAADVIEAQKGERPLVVPHGLLGEFRPPPDPVERIRRSPATARRVLHLTSTVGDRKGTAALLKAWGHLARRPGDRLIILCADEGVCASVRVAMDLAARSAMAVRPLDLAAVELRVGGSAAPGAMAALYQAHDLLVQPSRAEGFGMAPLEALAAGVPVLATNATGHTEWFSDRRAIVPIAHGFDAPIDDHEGSKAPVVSPLAIAEALCVALGRRHELQAKAEADRASVFAEWAWPQVIRPFLEHVESDQ